MGQQRAYHSKTTTGCRTCRRRRIKCDEARPWCKQCRRSARVCEGYAPPRQTWLFEPLTKQAKNDPGAPEAPSSRCGRSDFEKLHPAEDSLQPREIVPCQAHPNDGIPTKSGRLLKPKTPSIVAQWEFSLPSSPSGPYRGQEEQYLFKYYVEVVVSTYYVSRSQLGEPFWSVYLPQIAWRLPGTRYALLSMTKLFQDCARDVFVDMPHPKLHIEAMTYESLAMTCVMQQSSFIEGVLMTSITFWVIALCSSDWGRMLQHAYFAQKMISAVAETGMKIENPKVFAFCDFLSHACLVYYRTTRGDCAIHPGHNFMSCDVSCFTPEDCPLYVRLADALYHLRKARLGIAACKRLLVSRKQLYGQHPELHELLDSSLRKVSYLIRRWSDSTYLDLPPTFEEDAQLFISVPYSKSPFDKVLQDLAHGIYEGDSAAVLMKHVEHLLHDGTISPNLYVSVGRDDEQIRREFHRLVFLGSDAQGESNLQLDLTMFMETGAVSAEEQRLWASFVDATGGLTESTGKATYLSDRLGSE